MNMILHVDTCPKNEEPQIGHKLDAIVNLVWLLCAPILGSFRSVWSDLYSQFVDPNVAIYRVKGLPQSLGM